jgi:hypothetical protein
LTKSLNRYYAFGMAVMDHAERHTKLTEQEKGIIFGVLLGTLLGQFISAIQKQSVQVGEVAHVLKSGQPAGRY